MTLTRRLAVIFSGALLLATATAEANAIIVINPGPGLLANAPALAAWNRAADMWEAFLQDPITVTVDAEMEDMGSPSVIGGTSAVFLGTGYTFMRNAIVADAADEADDAIVGSLPTAAQISITTPAAAPWDGSIFGTKANLKAMGLLGLDAQFGVSDGQITFNDTFAFDYDNSNGVDAGKIDFETVAAHEIGHLLGFVSDVDIRDLIMDLGIQALWSVTPLDLFRFAHGAEPTNAAQFATATRSNVPGVEAVFSDTANTWRMSTGATQGDGRQASHWRDDDVSGLVFIGVMDPTLAAGVVEPILASDLRALDVIGWDILSAPEPGVLLLIATGIVGLRARRKRL
jgi:hypothetical protein